MGDGGHALRRGDVVALPRRIGFGRGEALELFLVLQSERFAAFLPTVVVAPLDEAVPAYRDYPGAIPVTIAGPQPRAMVVLVSALRSVRPERFDGTVRGRVERSVLTSVDRALRVLLAMG